MLSRPTRRDVEGRAERIEERAGAAAHEGAVHDSGPARRFAAEIDVLGGRELRHEGELLVDDRDAGFARRAWRGEVGFALVHLDGSRIAAVGAGENFHQGGLAGAVLAE